MLNIIVKIIDVLEKALLFELLTRLPLLGRMPVRNRCLPEVGGAPAEGVATFMAGDDGSSTI